MKVACDDSVKNATRVCLNKTLLCLIGTLRGGHHTLTSLREHVVRPLQADVAILASYNTNLSVVNKVLSPMHVWRCYEHDNWRDFMAQNFGLQWDKRVYLHGNTWGGIDSFLGSGAIIMALRFVLLRYLDALDGAMYSRLIVSRTDNYYICNEKDVWPIRTEVYTPFGKTQWGGVTDKFTIVHFSERRKVLNVLPWMLSQNVTLPGPEALLAQFYKANGLTLLFIPRASFTAAYVNPNTMISDTRRWSQPKRECFPSLWVKYPPEHNESVLHCTLDPCSSTRLSLHIPLKSGAHSETLEVMTMPP